KTVRGRLTQALFVRHFQYHGRSSVIGLHAASADNLALWGGVDIDWHGPESTTPGVNLQGALACDQELVRPGFRPLLITSTGRGGYHLRLLFASPIPAGASSTFSARSPPTTGNSACQLHPNTSRSNPMFAVAGKGWATG